MANTLEIMRETNQLKKDLIRAVATMERKDTIREIRLRIGELQRQCPHRDSNLNFEIVDGTCPYCGKTLFT